MSIGSDEWDPEVTIKATFTDTTVGGEYTIRTVAFGLSPAILITPEFAEEEVCFNLEAIDFDPEGVIEVLEMLAEGLAEQLQLRGDE